MKKSLQNNLTSILGFLVVIAGIATLFIPVAQAVMTPVYYVLTFLFGLILIYVKNEKAVELTKAILDKFAK